VKRYETASTVKVSQEAITLIQRALEAAGVEFLNHGQPGVRLKAVEPDEDDDEDTK